MTDADRTELFAALAALAARYPHWRVGQLVANVAGYLCGCGGAAVACRSEVVGREEGRGSRRQFG